MKFLIDEYFLLIKELEFYLNENREGEIKSKLNYKFREVENKIKMLNEEDLKVFLENVAKKFT